MQNYKEMMKMHNFDSQHKVYCKCNHGTGVVFYNTGVDRLICPNCHCFIYKDKKVEMKYKLREKGVRL